MYYKQLEKDKYIRQIANKDLLPGSWQQKWDGPGNHFYEATPQPSKILARDADGRAVSTSDPKGTERYMYTDCSFDQKSTVDTRADITIRIADIALQYGEADNVPQNVIDLTGRLATTNPASSRVA